MIYCMQVFLLLVLLSVYPAIALSSPFPENRQTKCYDNDGEITCSQLEHQNYPPDAHLPPRHFDSKQSHEGVISPGDAAYADDGGAAIMNYPKGMAQEEILFLSTRAGNYEIYKVSNDGTDLTRLTNTSADEYDARWSPDGKTIIYEKNDQIWLMDNDGGNQRFLLDGRHGVFSPDGTKIAYSAYSGIFDGGYDLYVYDLTTGQSTDIYASVGNDEHPDWSPDGQKIVFRNHFFMYGGSQAYIIKIDADGSNAVTLTHVNSDYDKYAWANSPKFSPDGTRILYHYYDDRNFSNYEIFVMNSDGSEQKRLTLNSNSTIANCWAVWSPNGDMIAFRSGLSDGNSDIYIMNSDGSQQEKFISTGYNYPSDWITLEPDHQKAGFMPGVMMLFLLNDR